VDSVTVLPLFEGHRTVQAEGHWRNQLGDTLITPGWYLVRSDQPLGVLASYVLEPASEDGAVTWNLLDRELQAGVDYPILSIHSVPSVPVTIVP
jgi:dipeptidyl-peptidase 4